MYYLHKSAACLAACPDEGLSCVPALRWVRVLWPTLSERHRRVTWLLCEVVPAVPGFQIRVQFRWSWALVFLSLLGTVVGSAELSPVFLPCWFTSAVMNSGVGCVFAGRAVGGSCVDAPRRLRRCRDARLAQSEALSHRVLMACCSASGIGQPLSCAVARSYFTLFDSRVRRLVRILI